MRYEPIPELTRAEVEAAVERDDPGELLYAVLAAALYADDPAWAEGVCLRAASHRDPNVRGNAVLGFGHLARLHGRLDRLRVEPVIAAALDDPDPYVRGHAHNAAGDVSHFLGWAVRGPRGV
jgi:hypothetical protein